MIRIDVVNEMEQIKHLIKNTLDYSNFHYISVKLALEELLMEYKTASEKYAKCSVIKDITGQNKDIDV